jgi:hypothetical protein
MAHEITIGQYVATEARLPENCSAVRRTLEYVATLQGKTLADIGAMPIAELEPQVEAMASVLAKIPQEWDAFMDSVRIGDTLYWLDLKPETMTVAQWMDIETICEEPRPHARIIPLLAICLTTDPDAPYSSSRLHQAEAVAQMPVTQALSLASFFLTQWQACVEDTQHYIAGLQAMAADASAAATTPPPTH